VFPFAGARLRSHCDSKSARYGDKRQRLRDSGRELRDPELGVGCDHTGTSVVPVKQIEASAELQESSPGWCAAGEECALRLTEIAKPQLVYSTGLNGPGMRNIDLLRPSKLLLPNPCSRLGVAAWNLVMAVRRTNR